MNLLRRTSAAAFLLVLSLTVFAQKREKTDSLVRLMSATSARMYERMGQKFRRVEGPARFLHNDTYLLCDTAIWSVDEQVINAYGNVKLIQDETTLTSDKLTYLIEEDLAQFRGGVVEMLDKDGNVLRTNYLDYNTKDSTAIFRLGASMRGKDGQVIESLDGSYDSKQKVFTFENEVNMFTDTLFVRTQKLEYGTETGLARFAAPIDVWKDENMLSSRSGWYDRSSETFLFTDDVHAMTDDQEVWGDSLFFYRNSNDVEMLGSVQVRDDSRSITAMSEYMFYSDSLSLLTIRDDVGMRIESDDTTYLASDKVLYKTVLRGDIGSHLLDESKKRLTAIASDPVGDYRKENAPASSSDDTEDNAIAAAPAVDSTSKISFITATGSVKIWREDIQIACDSLEFSDLDSLARLYLDPVIWNEDSRQYSADSIFFLISEGHLKMADLMTNAFVAIQEDEKLFDQITSDEILAYFDTTMSLTRFDALGGATALFFLQENGAYATVNKAGSEMMSANFKDGTIEKVFYYKEPSNDAYPLVQLGDDDRQLGGFKWEPERKPVSGEGLLLQDDRISQREEYASREKTSFRQTGRYFPGYMDSVYEGIEEDRRRRSEESATEPVPVSLDTVAVSADSLASALKAAQDSSLVLVDSLGIAADSLSVALDSVAVEVADTVQVLTRKQILEQRRALKDAEREARWARLDSLDAAKAKVREAKALEKKRDRIYRKVLSRDRERAREDRIRNRYVEMYRKKRQKELSK